MDICIKSLAIGKLLLVTKTASNVHESKENLLVFVYKW